MTATFGTVFSVTAAWDAEAGVWHVSGSDIQGLNVEGETFEAFSQQVRLAAADLLALNHDVSGTGTVALEITARRSEEIPLAP